MHGSGGSGGSPIGEQYPSKIENTLSMIGYIPNKLANHFTGDLNGMNNWAENENILLPPFDRFLLDVFHNGTES